MTPPGRIAFRDVRGSLIRATVALALAALLTGCAASSHENRPRPPLVQVLSIYVSPETIEVAPRVLDLPGQRPININQNENAPAGQSDPAAPAVIDVRFANQTRRDAPLVIEGPSDAVRSMSAGSPGSFTVALEPGIYRISSPASAGTTRFAIGRSRISSASDLLSP